MGCEGLVPTPAGKVPGGPRLASDRHHPLVRVHPDVIVGVRDGLQDPPDSLQAALQPLRSVKSQKLPDGSEGLEQNRRLKRSEGEVQGDTVQFCPRLEHPFPLRSEMRRMSRPETPIHRF